MNHIVVLGRTPFDYESINIPAAGVTRLNANLRETYGVVFITIEDNNIRYRIDGGDPSAVEGHLVLSGQHIYLTDPKSIKAIRMIGIGGAASIRATYYQ